LTSPSAEAGGGVKRSTGRRPPRSGPLDAGDRRRKVVFSRTLRTAEWANTTIAAGDTTEEIDKLRRGGDGHIVVWGAVSFWRSLMQLDLIDEFFTRAAAPAVPSRVVLDAYVSADA
jgi:dihydrofolate reductase